MVPTRLPRALAFNHYANLNSPQILVRTQPAHLPRCHQMGQQAVRMYEGCLMSIPVIFPSLLLKTFTITPPAVPSFLYSLSHVSTAPQFPTIQVTEELSE